MKNTIQAEYSVIGALLHSNDAIDQIPDLQARHFHDQENRAYFAEIVRQIKNGQTCDAITVFESLHDSLPDCLITLNRIQSSTPGYANIKKYAESVLFEAVRRFSSSEIANQLEAIKTAQNPFNAVSELIGLLDRITARQTVQEPVLLNDLMSSYAELLEKRMSGEIRPTATGFPSLDEKLAGGFEKGTLAVVAGRPGMGKTAFALALARNVSFEGKSLFLSMEMPKSQICDRNIAALGKLPLRWLKKPGEAGEREDEYWKRVTAALGQVNVMNLFVDDQTALDLDAIRNKARKIKRKQGLDLLVIDQLSFITGAKSERQHEAIGEYTRGLLALAKELDVPVVLLCQLNRECEKRMDKRPMLSDLAMSGSIEQDAETIIFLYRDEIYNPDSRDKGICEVIIAKQRQGEIGKVGLSYFGSETRFAEPDRPWIEQHGEPKKSKSKFLDSL